MSGAPLEEAVETYRRQLSKTLGNGMEVFLFWKGRVSLYSILRALGIGQGDEVVVPGFTCVVVPNAVKYTGAIPVYADIDEDTYTVTRETIEPVVTTRTKAVIAQNTYGLSADLDPIMELTKSNNIEVIDDCAHGFGGTYKGNLNGTITRTAFFSSQWNKPFSTGIGGFAVTSDEKIGKKLRAIEAECSAPTAREAALLFMMLAARRHVMNGRLYWPLLKLYRSLSAGGIVVGSSESDELKSIQMPRGYLKRQSSVQARAGLKGLAAYSIVRRQRQVIADEYDSLMEEVGKPSPARPGYAEHLFLKYPIKVREREKFIRKAENDSIPIGDWFLSPLHPVMTDLARWNYEAGSCPVAERLAARMVNLPTDPELTRREVERVKAFVRRNSEHIQE